MFDNTADYNATDNSTIVVRSNFGEYMIRSCYQSNLHSFHTTLWVVGTQFFSILSLSLLSKAMRYLNGYCPRFKVYVPGAPATDFIGKPIGLFFFQLK